MRKSIIALTPLMIAPLCWAQEKPNVVIFLVDDMGYSDIGCYGGEIMTPNLDKLASTGVRFTQFYNTSRSCPARASLMTGLYQHQAGIGQMSEDPGTFKKETQRDINDWGSEGYQGYLNRNCVTIAEVLKENGYHTYMAGKWHLGMHGQEKWPLQRGFERFYGILAGAASYLRPEGGRGLTLDNEHLPAPESPYYTTDAFTDHALQFVGEQKDDKPFFLYLAFPAPHGSLSAPACAYPAGLGRDGGLQWEKKDGYEACNTAADGWSGVEGDFSPDTYIYPEHEVFGRTESRHATMIRRVDDVLKDMIQLLKDLGIDDNTMIVFTSDNGPHNEPGSGNYGNGAQDPAYFMSYGMMDGIKRDCWEGGMRVPAVVRWPGVVPSGISLNASQFQDWMATFADVAGVPVPSRCDGVSLLPTLAGVPERQKTGVIYAEYAYSGSTPNYSDFLQQHRGRGRQQQQIIFVDGFKGIRMGNAAPTTDFEIYDTEKDPQEAANLAASRPDLQEKMKAQALRSRRSSPIASTSFDAGYIAPVSAPAGLREGRLRWRAWNRSFDWVPDFRQLEEGPCSTGATDVSDVLSVKAGLSGQKGVELTGYLRVPVTGEYQFYLQTDSNEGSRAFVHLHDMQLIDADYAYTPGTQAASNAREGVSGDVQPNAVQTVKLTAGLHPIRIGYVGKAASSSLSLQWEGPETSGREPIPASAFSYEYVNPFNLEKTEETVGCAASGTGLTVQTHLPWTVSCDQPWVTVSPVSGSGTSVLDIAVEANGLQTEREAVVTVVCGGEQRTFTLRQEAAPAPAGYDKWKQDHFADGTPDEQMAPDACPAGDGISNLMKYATGMDPNQPCGSVTKLAVREEAGGKYLVLSWSVNPEATDVTFHVESSSDLEEWADEGAVTPDGACGEFRDTVALGKGSPERRFLRLKVTR